MPKVRRRAGERLSKLQLSIAIHQVPLASDAEAAPPASQLLQDENHIKFPQFPNAPSNSGSISSLAEASSEDADIVIETPGTSDTEEESSSTDCGDEEKLGGWTSQQICTLIMYTAKSTGTANSTLDKFLKIFSLLVDTGRHSNDADKRRKFPRSTKSLGIFLGLKPPSKQHVVYICPTRKECKKRGQKIPTFEMCGYTLNIINEWPNRQYVCDLCETEWDKKEIEKDGNCFSAVPMHELLTSTMERYGKYCSSRIEKSVDNTLRDVYDGQRWLEMDLKPEDCDLVLTIWADTASISESTKRKMYVMFLHVLNVPVRVRLNVWPMLLVWVGETLPKDREAFVLFVTEQLQTLHRSSDRFQAVQWRSREGEMVSSAAYVHSVWADSPERTALNGHLSHSAGEGCIYCLQVAECINHRMCYAYKKHVELKQHKHFVDFAEEWDRMPTREKTYILDERLTRGFRRPSLLRFWEKFDMVFAFLLDVMHQYDEGVVRWIIAQIVAVDGNSGITKANLNAIERSWLSIGVPGNQNRKVRSLMEYKTWKAHELRFFIQNAAPFVTRGNCPEGFYFQICLLSRIAWLATRNTITESDLNEIEMKCKQFVKAFQKYFGVKQMKYSIHLMLHLKLTIKLFGPLRHISCYRPENEIGRITRKICGTYNSTKSIMDSFLKLQECTVRMEDMMYDENVSVATTAGIIMGVPQTQYAGKGAAGTCRLIGKFELIEQEDVFVALQEEAGSKKERWPRDQIYCFKKAAVEVGMIVRTCAHNEFHGKNEYIVMDDEERVLKIRLIIAIMDSSKMKVLHTFVYATLHQSIPESELEERTAGMYKAECPHIFSVEPTCEILVRTSKLKKQLAFLASTDEPLGFVVSPPSSVYMTT